MNNLNYELTSDWVKVYENHEDQGRTDYYNYYYAKINTKTKEEISKFEKVKGFDCPPLFTKDDFIYRYDKTEESKGDEWNSTTNIIEWFVCVEKNAEIRKEYLRTYDYFAG